MEPKDHLFERKIIFQTIIFGFHVNLPGCISGIPKETPIPSGCGEEAVLHGKRYFQAFKKEVVCGPFCFSMVQVLISYMLHECNEWLFGMRDEVILCWIYDLT